MYRLPGNLLKSNFIIQLGNEIHWHISFILFIVTLLLQILQIL